LNKGASLREWVRQHSTSGKGDAPYERGYHNEEGGLLPPSPPSMEETQEVPTR
jgi:hypothetical protein